MNLPKHDELNIQALSRCFSNMSESYKLFWFIGILDAVSQGENTISFRELISRMLVHAWYMVSEFHLNLGPLDTLEKLALYSQTVSGLKSSSKEEDILRFAQNSTDKTVLDYLKTLTLNVPYRFLSPFNNDLNWNNSKEVIDQINQDFSLPYAFSEEKGLDRSILIRPQWQTYFRENLSILYGWTEYNMIVYLQRRNPSVPGIANKLAPATERELTTAKKFWKGILDVCPVPNIYAPDESLLVSSSISIDHFVPWSYVSHDELWNLIPTTRSDNSSKSDRLAPWNTFFPRFCDVEFQAYEAIWKQDKIRDLFENCKKEHLNSDNALKLYAPGKKKEAYTNELEELVLPVYTAAKNLGFDVWPVAKEYSYG